MAASCFGDASASLYRFANALREVLDLDALPTKDGHAGYRDETARFYLGEWPDDEPRDRASAREGYS